MFCRHSIFHRTKNFCQFLKNQKYIKNKSNLYFGHINILLARVTASTRKHRHGRILTNMIVRKRPKSPFHFPDSKGDSKKMFTIILTINLLAVQSILTSRANWKSLLQTGQPVAQTKKVCSKLANFGEVNFDCWEVNFDCKRKLKKLPSKWLTLVRSVLTAQQSVLTTQLP